MFRKALPFVLLALALGAGAAWLFLRTPPLPDRPDIPFAAAVDPDLSDPDNPLRRYPLDLARVEAEVPLSRAALLSLTPGNLKTFSQEELDQIYGRLTAGPIPDGIYAGSLIFPRGADGSLAPRLQEVLGGIGGEIAGDKIERIERVGELLWKGKVFDRETRVLRNMIEDLKAFGPLIDDASALPELTIPRRSWLRIVRPTTTVRLMFPAKLYCGQSLIDGRREAVIIDYAYADEIEGYQPGPDALASRDGLRIRDEIRMVRPGLYLGRAYANRVFLVNFFLYNEDVANAAAADFAAGKSPPEDCWAGEQLRQVLLE
ncbi:MAG: hypothetical protein RLZZ528_1957 [Pseudomonadota bacterium]|jgi:hypothetical protein